MRIALVGSPRCGNNWVRRVMSDVLGYPHFAAHSVEEFPKELPPDCILNIHALNEPPDNAFLRSTHAKLSCWLVTHWTSLSQYYNLQDTSLPFISGWTGHVEYRATRQVCVQMTLALLIG